MSVWHHYIVTENKPVTEEDIENALQQSSRRWYVDGDLIVQKPTEDARPNYNDDSPDLICGQMTFAEFDDGLTEEDEPNFYAWAEDTDRKDELSAVFRAVQSMISVQVVNSGLFSESEEPLAPLWDWFLHNRQGVLVNNAGEFYSKSGRLG